MEANASIPIEASRRCLYSFNRYGLLSTAWLVCGISSVGLLSAQLTFGLSLWKVQLSRIVLASLLAAPVFAALLADRQRDSSGSVRWLAALAITGASYLPTLVYLILLTPGFPVPFLLVAIAAGFVVALLPLLLGHQLVGKAAGVSGVVFAMLVGIGAGVENTFDWTIVATAERLKGPAVIVRTVPTALHNLRVTSYRKFVDAEVAGGGIAILDDGYLVASGEGTLFFIERDSDSGTLFVNPLSVRIPINHAEFFSETRQGGGTRTEYSHLSIAPTWFRVTDLLVEEKADFVKLFAVHNYWRTEESCLVLRVSVLSARSKDILSQDFTPVWQTLFDSTPCLQFTNESQGGSLVRLIDGSLLLSVGVHDDSNDLSAQNLDNHYGKSILIDEDMQRIEVFTSGHRNPQGLATSRSGQIWQTEHGPRGGDELNQLVLGANYGWPVVSYGVPYFEGVPSPLSGFSGLHEGFEKPAFAWVPSIGISSLIEISGELFPLWKDDLMIGSLVRTTLWRTRIVDHRVAYVEEIKLDERIRDIIEDWAGRLVLWTDNHSLVFIEPASSDRGNNKSYSKEDSVTIARCLSCHVSVDGAIHGRAPTLRGLLGRSIASVEGYEYSAALRKVGGVWSEDRINLFLTNPQVFAPGSSPEMQAVPDATERQKIIEYLRNTN